MRWPWEKWQKARNQALSVADPSLIALFSPGAQLDELAGVAVGEGSALGLSAFYRAMSLISGQLASLPLNSYRTTGDGREQVRSIFDDPDGPDGQTPYEWKETAFLHLLMHGRAGAIKVTNEAGGLTRLPLVHPLSFRPTWPTHEEAADPVRRPVGGLWFDITLDTGRQVRLDQRDFWYVPGLSLDGRTGISLITYARRSLGTAIAGDKASATQFSRGAMISGLATPDDDEDIVDDIPVLRRDLNRAVSGYENAGTIAIVARRLKLQPWTMTNTDAQFLQSRQFLIEEISRWTGVPPHLLMQTEKQTSWGTGVEMQDRALGRSVLGTWSSRFEERASRLLAAPRNVEFDFTALERPAPDREIELDLSQVAAGVMTVDEYRHKRGWPPLPTQDQLPAPTPDPAEQGATDDPPE